MKIDNTTEKEKKDRVEMSQRYKRARVIVQELMQNGFTKKQAIFLLNFLNDYLPIY